MEIQKLLPVSISESTHFADAAIQPEEWEESSTVSTRASAVRTVPEDTTEKMKEIETEKVNEKEREEAENKVKRTAKEKEKETESEKEKGNEDDASEIRSPSVPLLSLRVPKATRKTVMPLASLTSTTKRHVKLLLKSTMASNSVLPSLAAVEVVFPLPHSLVAIAFNSSDIWILDSAVLHHSDLCSLTHPF